jgi:riboflavin biosynthesis pyrimidine reductase
MDDPQLTVRRVSGPSPARVIVDPSGRLPTTAKVLAVDGVRRLVITRKGTANRFPSGVEIAALPESDGHIAPAAILAALAARGFRRILIEGGANTVSRFLEARCLDRLHVMIAPIIIGAGPSSVTLPPIARVEQALRAPIRAHVLGEELLVDCDLSAQRVPVGAANTSM